MFGKLKKLFKSEIKKPISKMSNYNDLSPEELHEKLSAFDFTWIKGDMTGNTERYVSISANPGAPRFVIFQSGNRMNVDLLDEYMTTFPKAPSNVSFESTAVPAPIPTPTRSATPVQNIAKVESSVQGISYTEDRNNNSDSPIYKLLSKQKKNMVDVNIKLKINLPSPELFIVLTDSFEGAEDEVIEFIINGIDIDEIKKSLADSIKKNYYNKSIKNAEKNTTTSKNKQNQVEAE